MGTIKATNIEPIADNGTVTLGSSGDTITIPSGATLDLSSATQTGVGGKMTPSFHAYLGTEQSLSSGSTTKIQIDTEVYDSDNCYDHTTNYRFTPNVAGKYFVFGSIRFRHASGQEYTTQTKIYKNGANVVGNNFEFQNNVSYGQSVQTSGIIDMNGTTDYLELYGFLEWHSSGTISVKTDLYGTNFKAFKIIE